MNDKLIEVASQLEEEAKTKTDLANRIRELVTGEKKPTFSPEGLERIREAAKAQWRDCPLECGIKHRLGHPHLKKQSHRAEEAA